MLLLLHGLGPHKCPNVKWWFSIYCGFYYKLFSTDYTQQSVNSPC